MVGAGACSEQEKRTALDRVLRSHTFSRSEQLRCFLRYVCEAHFDGSTDGVNEYLIGVKVLHRPPNYSPAEDSSVRTRAYELRQKLDKLYATELTDEPVQIMIPKGSYMPVFTAVSASIKAGADPVPTSVVETAAVPKPIRAFLSLTVLVSCCLGALAMFGVDTRLRPRPASPDPILTEAWAPFAKNLSSVLLVPATPLYLVFGPESHGAYDTPIYPAPDAAYPRFREHRPLPPGQKLGMIFTNDALGVGNMNAVILTSNVLRDLGATSQVLPERSAMMSVIHGRDAVLFGAPVDSQAISTVLEKTPLSVVYDEGVNEFVVRDREHGETFYPEKNADGDFRTVYGLITVLNTRDSDHGRLGMVVFSGVTSVGTNGAAEYFTSPRQLRHLGHVLSKNGPDRFPAAYQVVVKCRFENMLLVSTEYQAHRILPAE